MTALHSISSILGGLCDTQHINLIATFGCLIRFYSDGDKAVILEIVCDIKR